MRLLAPLAILLVPATLLAQQSPGINGVGTGPGSPYGLAHRTVTSPEVLPDGRVTFRLVAPKATEVVLQGDWPGGLDLAMARDASGQWAVTTPALQPEIWTYTFVVDGVPALDPRNYNVLRDGTRYMNWVLVPGPASALYQAGKVPHGTVTMTWFPPPRLKASRRMLVYTPPGYEGGTAPYPVLYLLHGLNGTFSDWERRTQLTELLQAYRLIVVMPEGQNSWYGDSVERPADRFETYVLDDVVADVEKQYRAIGTRHARAVAGLSMGGYGAMKFALKRPAQFLVAGSFSGAFSLVRAGAPASPAPPPADETPFARTVRETVTAAYGPPGSEARAANDLFALAQQADVSRLPYLYVDCGTEDGLLRINREFAALLHERKVVFEYHELPGAHTWDYWDRQIGEFLRVLARRMPIDGPPRRP